MRAAKETGLALLSRTCLHIEVSEEKCEVVGMVLNVGDGREELQQLFISYKSALVLWLFSLLLQLALHCSYLS